MTTQNTLQPPSQNQKARQLAEAEGLHRQILSQQPGNVESFYQLGAIFHQTGRTDDALFAYRRATELDPTFVQAWSDLGGVLCQLRRYDQAIEPCRRALALERNRFAPLLNLGNALAELGQLSEGAELCRRAVSVRPEAAIAHFTLANILDKMNQPQEAIAAYVKALSIQPDFAAAHYNIGNVLSRIGRLSEAVAAYRQAVALQPGFAPAHYNLGKLLHEAGELAEGETAYRRAIAAQPDHADAHFNLANLCLQAGRLDEAILGFKTTLSLRRDWPQARINLAGALESTGRLAEATEIYASVTVLWPQLPIGHYNLAGSLLRQGDLARGFKEYEWRWQVWDKNAPRTMYSSPQWTGQDLRGRRILFVGEQGYGDIIQFVRYATQIAEQGAQVILVCPRELQSTLKNPGPDGNGIGKLVHEWVDLNAPLPEYDFYSPLMSLPRIFNTTMETIPAKVPYVWADAQRAQTWRDRLAGDDRKKVALVWAGRGQPDPKRNVQLAQLAPLSEIPGIRWISLQLGEGAEQTKSPPPGMDLTDWTSDLTDFAETAALIANLDLVITIDTAVAHLAGAMGKPVWTLLQYVADWRWFVNRNDSPWYPSMRLFRQAQVGNWSAPIAKVAEMLRTP